VTSRCMSVRSNLLTGFSVDGRTASREKARVSRRMPPSANNASAASARYARSGVHGTLRTTASAHAPGSVMRLALACLKGTFRYQVGARRRTFAAVRGSAGWPSGQRWRRVGTL
jgi:hypothetical protein